MVQIGYLNKAEKELLAKFGATIGKVGFVGCVTSTDKDAGVTLSFGTLTVSADLI